MKNTVNFNLMKLFKKNSNLNWKKKPSHPFNGFGKATEYVIVVWVSVFEIISKSDFQKTGLGIDLSGFLGSAINNLKSRLFIFNLLNYLKLINFQNKINRLLLNVWA